MGSDVGQIFPTASLHLDHSILYVLVCEKELSHMGKNNGNPDLVCEKNISFTISLLHYHDDLLLLSLILFEN